MNEKVVVTAENVYEKLVEVANYDRLQMICKDIAKLVEEKNSDYGDAWQRWGVFTPLVRINDKILRLETISSGKRMLIADENVEDTLRDILGYAALALLWIDKYREIK